MMNTPQTFFPLLSEKQLAQYAQMETLYIEWNARINVISRKDMAYFPVRHLLHSLSIAQVINFTPGTRIMDAGTGGGFPGIPLAVMFPDTEFVLVDSIGKKIKVIDAIKSDLGLFNVSTQNTRFESIVQPFDFITGRAVSNLTLFADMVKKNIRKQGQSPIRNGILYLTGGETESSLNLMRAKTKTWNLSDFFPDPFFITKKLIHLSDFQ